MKWKVDSPIALFLMMSCTVGVLNDQAAWKSASKNVPAEPEYLIFQLGTDKRDLETLLLEIRAEFGAEAAGGPRYVGFGVALMTLKTPVEELESQVVRALDLAEQTGMPVLL